VGFILVFLYEPILHSLFLSTSVVSPLYPWNVFVELYHSLAHNVNLLYFFVVISLIIGFFATDVVISWNKLVWEVLGRFRVRVSLVKVISRFSGSASMGSTELGSKSTTEIQEDVGFRVWLLSEKGGTPARFLDSSGFYFTLNRYYKHAFILFAELWFVWGVFEYYRLFHDNSLVSVLIYQNAAGFFEFLSVLAIGISLYLVSRRQTISGAKFIEKVWRDLYSEYLRKKS
jgi:hypothetical protein